MGGRVVRNLRNTGGTTRYLYRWTRGHGTEVFREIGFKSSIEVVDEVVKRGRGGRRIGKCDSVVRYFRVEGKNAPT